MTDRKKDQETQHVVVSHPGPGGSGIAPSASLWCASHGIFSPSSPLIVLGIRVGGIAIAATENAIYGVCATSEIQYTDIVHGMQAEKLGKMLWISCGAVAGSVA
jgi:hypothetical protein